MPFYPTSPYLLPILLLLCSNLFMTAAHVYEAAAAGSAQVAVARLTPGRQQAQTVRDVERDFLTVEPAFVR